MTEEQLIERDGRLIEAVARRVVELLDERDARSPAGGPSRRFVSVQELAELLAVSEAWVYDHKRELGAVKLGSGGSARLRFSLDLVERRLARNGPAADPNGGPGGRPRPRPDRRSDGLLPIAGGALGHA